MMQDLAKSQDTTKAVVDKTNFLQKGMGKTTGCRSEPPLPTRERELKYWQMAVSRPLIDIT